MADTDLIDITEPSTVRDVARLVRDLHQPALLNLAEVAEKPTLVVLPKAGGGFEHIAAKKLLEPYLTAPERREGTATLTDLDSFIAWVLRFKDPQSVIYACDDPSKPSVEAVIDYHEAADAGGPRFGKHRATYAFPLHRTWKAWAEVERRGPLTMIQLAELIEERIVDIIPPPPAPEALGEAEDPFVHLRARLVRIGGTVAGPDTMRALSRGFEVHESSRIKEANVLENGTRQLVFEQQHETTVGTEKITVPSCFVVGTPIFHRGEGYLMPIRLRYEKSGGGVVRWRLLRHEPDVLFEHAFEEALAKVRAETGLPVLRGSPER